MNIKGFRRMLFGEKMPDKNDPKYKDRYEREVSAGRKFAQATRIDKAAAKVQGFANAHRILFLVIRLRFRYRRVHLEHLSHYDGIPQQPADTHGDGNAGFGAAGKTQEAARG